MTNDDGDRNKKEPIRLFARSEKKEKGKEKKNFLVSDEFLLFATTRYSSTCYSVISFLILLINQM
jgi:hypothetical protein